MGTPLSCSAEGSSRNVIASSNVIIVEAAIFLLYLFNGISRIASLILD